VTYKADWSTGDILTAAQQNSLAEQAVSRFADASARNAAITSPSEGQTCWLNDTNEFQIYDGSSWKPLLDTDTFSVSGGNYTISTDLTVSGDVTIQGLDMDTIVEGDVIYGSGADTLARLAKGSDDEVLTLASGVPSWAAASSGISWSGSTANGIGTYGSSSSVVAESTATYDGTTLELTQSGGGVNMDGLNSSDANTLDDYEEGTWTCALTASTSGTISVGDDLGYYTKVGRVVHVQGRFTVASVSSPVGTLRVGGLPFTSTASVSEGPDVGNNMGTVVNLANAKTGIITKLHPNGTYMDMNAGSGGTSEDASLADDVDSGSYFLISGTYVAAT
jgi:hypothetical protein